MQLITMTSGLWAMDNPMEYAVENSEAPLQVWTPPRWDGMSQEEAGFWWTTVPVPNGQRIHSLEDYRALLVWLLNVKQQQHILDLQMEGATMSQAIHDAMEQIKAVISPELPGDATIPNLLNFSHAPLRRAVFPMGIECFPVSPETTVNGTMEVLLTWNFIDWMNQFRAEVVEGKSW